MVDLVLRPSSQSKNPHLRWALQLRYHESLGETEYVTLCRVSDAAAQEIVRAGQAYWLFEDPTARPDWKVELDRLEPEEMSGDEMKLEIARLRIENARLKRAGDPPANEPAREPPEQSTKQPAEQPASPVGARWPQGCADQRHCGYRRIETNPPTDLGVCSNLSCRHAVRALGAATT